MTGLEIQEGIFYAIPFVIGILGYMAGRMR